MDSGQKCTLHVITNVSNLICNYFGQRQKNKKFNMVIKEEIMSLVNDP